MKLAQFKNKTFSTNAAFLTWLGNNTSKKIALLDLGQDMQRIHIHESGEILHCDFQSSIYNGKFVNIDNIKIGQTLEIYEDGKGFIPYGRLIIDEIN